VFRLFDHDTYADIHERSCLCKDIVSDPTAMSASFLVSSPTIPFQLPFEPRTNENRQKLNATETSEFRY